jgi:DNA-binding HxlR family transcriptional regulator/CheY-like chemotaxis protein
MTRIRYNCPVEVTLEVIGGKWKCVILWWLRRDAKRFGELMQLIPDISQKVLTDQLRELEADGLISRTEYREVPRRVEYALTTYGETLRPITDLMCRWGETHNPDCQFGTLRLEQVQVLVVARENTLRESIRTVLEERAAQVTIATSASEAQTYLNQGSMDVVVVDMEMPDEQAYTLLRQTRQLETDLGARIPTVALTRSSEEHSQALRAGFQIHLSKPVDSVELIAALASLASELD